MVLMLRGEPVVYVGRVQSGVDPFGQPRWDEVEETVENVLIAPVSSSDIVDNQELHGVTELYRLGIPKGDAHDWTRCKVRFWGKTWESVGTPQRGIDDLIPLAWGQNVTVKRFE